MCNRHAETAHSHIWSVCLRVWVQPCFLTLASIPFDDFNNFPFWLSKAYKYTVRALCQEHVYYLHTYAVKLNAANATIKCPCFLFKSNSICLHHRPASGLSVFDWSNERNISAAAVKKVDFLLTVRKALIQNRPQSTYNTPERSEYYYWVYWAVELSKQKKKNTLPYNLYLYHLDHLENKLEVSAQCYRTNGSTILTSH